MFIEKGMVSGHAQVIGSASVKANDIATKKLMWTQPISINSAQLPIVANNKVILTSRSGELLSFDVNTGSKKLIKNLGGKVEGQPIARKGML